MVYLFNFIIVFFEITFPLNKGVIIASFIIIFYGFVKVSFTIRMIGCLYHQSLIGLLMDLFLFSEISNLRSLVSLQNQCLDQ